MQNLITHSSKTNFGILLILFISIAPLSSSKTSPSNLQVTKNIASMPLAFTANNGQWDDKVKFRANSRGATMWFAPDGAYYQFTKTIASKPISMVDKRYGMPEDIFDSEPTAFETMMIKANFVGAKANPTMTGLDMIDYKCNYFIGNDKSKWATDVPNYTSILYEQIYEGIDLQYYGNGKQMEYDFIVSPGADYEQIQIEYEGAESIAVNSDGQLVVTTMWGEVIEQRPVIYQLDNDNNKVAIEGNYKLTGANAYGFELSGYNPALPLVIDPILTYSTYLGGSSEDVGRAITVDASGAAYVTGYTRSSDFPTLNPLQESYPGDFDCFVTKLNNSGTSLIFSTYIGGNELDASYDITLDNWGSIYITGETSSSEFPLVNPFQDTIKGHFDAFITKLNSSGNSLIYSTLLGGGSTDVSHAISVDSIGNSYITGYTLSTDFPTVNAYQNSFQGIIDIFVTKLNSSGNSLIYSTFLGGSSREISGSIAIDNEGAAYITGRTRSSDFPTLNPIQGIFQDTVDAFVTKLNSSGSSLVYSTFLGGTKYDDGRDIAVDALGNAYIVGMTQSNDFPTLNPYQATFQGGYRDIFVSKINSTGNNFVYSTYLGGSNDDYSKSLKVDYSGNVYISGMTWSNDFPILDSFQENLLGQIDAFVTKLNNSGNNIIYSTYLGGTWIEGAYDIAIDSSGAAYLTGWVRSIDFPIVGGYQDTHGLASLDDAFVARIAPMIACCEQQGDFDGNGGIDIADLTTTVNWMFKGGPPADCVNSADVNADCAADIADLTYRVDFMFKGGPGLVCGCVE